MRLVHRSHGPTIDVGKVRYWSGLTGDVGTCHFVTDATEPCAKRATRFFLLCYSSESDDVHVARFCDQCMEEALGPEGRRSWLGARIAYSVTRGEILAISVLVT